MFILDETNTSYDTFFNSFSIDGESPTLISTDDIYVNKFNSSISLNFGGDPYVTQKLTLILGNDNDYITTENDGRWAVNSKIDTFFENFTTVIDEVWYNQGEAYGELVFDFDNMEWYVDHDVKGKILQNVNFFIITPRRSE